MNIKKLLFTVIFLSFIGILELHAQETYSGTGGNSNGTGGSNSFTIGQVFYENISGFTNQVNEGVQHPWEVFKSPLVITISPKVVCKGDSVQLNVLVVGGAGNYEYSWSSVQSGFLTNISHPYVSPTVTTSYKVFVSDGFRWDSLTFSVVVNELPIVSFSGLNSVYCVDANPVALNGYPNGGDFTGDGIANSIFVPFLANTGSHQITYRFTDQNGCKSETTQNVYVDSLPLINAGNDTTIVQGVSTTIIGISPTSGYTYNWSTSEGLSDSTIANPMANPATKTTYILTTTNGSCSLKDSIIVDVWYRIMGTIKYDNVAASALNGFKLYLKKDGISIDSTIVNSGNFLFSGHPNGIYRVTFTPTIPFGGLNSSDALIIQRYFAGMISLNGLKLRTGDVNLSKTVNSADALLIKRRFAGLISTFPLSDWIIDTDSVLISNNTKNIEIKGICAGDVNGSYSFSSKAASVFFVENGIQKAEVNQNIIIPILTQNALKPGAISLIINYPDNFIDIKNISIPSVNSADLVTNITDGKIYLAWNNLTPLNLKANDTLLKISVIIKSLPNDGEFQFSVQTESEFADYQANVLQNVRLLCPVVKLPNTVDFSENLSDIMVFPNPTNDFIFLKIENPEGRNLSFQLFDALGKLLKEENIKNSETQISLKALPTATYFIKISELNKEIKTIKISKS